MLPDYKETRARRSMANRIFQANFERSLTTPTKQELRDMLAEAVRNTARPAEPQNKQT